MKLVTYLPVQIAGVAMISASLLVGCGDDVIVGRAGPSDAQTLVALQRMIEQGTKLMAVPLPPGIVISSAKVRKCDSAAPQLGYRCRVSVATPDLPLVGGLVTDVTIRFAKSGQSEWLRYLN